MVDLVMSFIVVPPGAWSAIPGVQGCGSADNEPGQKAPAFVDNKNDKYLPYINR
jgi:hypothetical protein